VTYWRLTNCIRGH